jgi:3-oxoacyl-[acyl-carrier protein] reductase
MDLGIKGKWALVCGASKGLGLGCAQALVAEGVNAVLVARGAADLDAAVSALRAAAPGVNVLGAVAGGPGKAFDILVNNAGGPPPGDFRSWERDDWIQALDANMLTPIELIKAVVDGMAQRGFGRVVNITSGAVKAPIGILGLSNGARSGLTGFVAGAARSPLAAQGVTINNLLPGAFETDRLKTTMAGAASKAGQPLDAVMDARRSTIPAKRFGHPQEFGAICAFLCSVHAGYMTGQNVLADGGAYPGTF